MPRKATYREDLMGARPTRVWYDAMAKIDWSQPVVIAGRKKGTDELFITSTSNGQATNSLLAKAMSFLKIS